MHAIDLLISFAVNVLTTFSISMNMASILTRAVTTTSAHLDDTNGTIGTCNGSPTPYVPSLPSSAIEIPSLIGTRVTGTLGG